MLSISSGLLLCVTLVLFAGCEQTLTKQATKTDFLDTDITELHSLGWLGAKAHPLNDVVNITDPDNANKNVSLGGMVIVELDEEMPLATAGLQAKDVIVRVAEDWVPIKEDPTRDLIRMVETQISGDKDSIELGYLRGGDYATITLNVDKPSIDDGLPLATERGIEASTLALQRLAELQLEDGSFAADSNDDGGRIAVTSMAGLAFLAADQSAVEEFKPNVDACLKFVAEQLGDVDQLDPLIVAYAGMFLAESDIGLMEEEWLDKVGAISGRFFSSQHESGGWNVTENSVEASTEVTKVASSDASPKGEANSEINPDLDSDTDKTEPLVDVFGTFSTSQVLLAIGALERKGMRGDNAIIEKGCAYLLEQADVRVPSHVDRRTKAALSASTAAALVALNCDRSDLKLKNQLNNALERTDDMFFAPSLGLPGLFQTALASRQIGNEPWLQFHNSFKHLAIALQGTAGNFHPYPNVERELLPFEQQVDGEAWNSAHFALILSMQSQSLKKLLALEQQPGLVTRGSSGKVAETASSGGAQVMKLDVTGANAEELKKMILDKLKEQGIEVDESKLKFQKGTVKPGKK